MPVRHEYVLALPAAGPWAPPPLPAGLVARAITVTDVQLLAGLMLAAYRGTIDYEGEEMAEAVAEVEGYFSGADGNAPLPQHSVALVRDDVIESACMVKHWLRRDCPLVAYVMSTADRKRQGLAAFVLGRTIAQLRRAGYSELRAVITEGNVASERLFQRAGFRR
ncbi:MAG: hypothetical protein JWQ76_3964 [Ramlibacter sp.]|nr:hypothetical protein [Ramlibacter sp.]